MTGVKLSKYYGIVIRKNALARQGVDTDTICQIMDVDKPYDEDISLISFGPHFGEEGAEEFVSRLRKLGLIYLEDFLVLWDDMPEWAEISIKLDSREVP